MKNSKPTTACTNRSARPPGVEEQIRCRAHQIYEERGKIVGHELDDWLQAETEIMTRKVMRKAAAAGRE
jgi:Protein of unknown function (DUF2934)